MTDYYAELGVEQGASQADLRRAYRNRARLLHPDLNSDERAAEAMRRLNEAWRVLGDPRSRWRYDEGRTGVDSGEPVDTESTPSHRVRPAMWMAAVALLVVIFVVTAYVAAPSPTRPLPAPQADRCLSHFPGYDGFVSCSQPNLGRVVAELPGNSATGCPAGTTTHAVLGRAEVACLAG